MNSLSLSLSFYLGERKRKHMQLWSLTCTEVVGSSWWMLTFHLLFTSAVMKLVPRGWTDHFPYAKPHVKLSSACVATPGNCTDDRNEFKWNRLNWWRSNAKKVTELDLGQCSVHLHVFAFQVHWLRFRVHPMALISILEMQANKSKTSEFGLIS